MSFLCEDGCYLRHCGWNLRSHPYEQAELYLKDATFTLLYDRFFPGTVSFESVNYPGKFISHRSFVLKIEGADDSDLHRNDASFFLEQAPPQLPPPIPVRSCMLREGSG